MGVGFDIACGNAAIRTDLTITDLAKRPSQLGASLRPLVVVMAGADEFDPSKDLRRGTLEDRQQLKQKKAGAEAGLPFQIRR